MNLHTRILPPPDRLIYSVSMATRDPKKTFLERHQTALDVLEARRDDLPKRLRCLTVGARSKAHPYFRPPDKGVR